MLWSYLRYCPGHQWQYPNLALLGLQCWSFRRYLALQGLWSHALSCVSQLQGINWYVLLSELKRPLLFLSLMLLCLSNCRTHPWALVSITSLVFDPAAWVILSIFILLWSASSALFLQPRAFHLVHSSVFSLRLHLWDWGYGYGASGWFPKVCARRFSCAVSCIWMEFTHFPIAELLSPYTFIYLLLLLHT